MKILIVLWKQKSVYCLQSKRRSLNICNDSSPRENIMNSLPSSYFGSCLREIAAGSSGLENRVDLEKYTQGWEGQVNGIAISSITVLWFFLQHPPLPLFGRRGGGNWAFRYIFKIGYDGGFGGWKKQFNKLSTIKTPPPLPRLLLGAREILIASSLLPFSEFCAFRGFPTRNLHKFATHEGLFLAHKNKQYVKAQNTHGVRHA